MDRFEELSKSLGEIAEVKRGFVLSLLRDFVFLEAQIDELRKYPRYVINPKDPTKQIKLPVHEMMKDYQAQKNDIATKILKALDGEGGDVSPLMKALARYE